LCAIFSALAQFLHSAQYAACARPTPESTAFSRKHKLPLPVLSAFLLNLPRSGLQSELFAFFDHALQGSVVCDSAPSKVAVCTARKPLAPDALRSLLHQQNTLAAAHLPLPQSLLWQGLRVLALDSTVLRTHDGSSPGQRTESRCISLDLLKQ